MEEPGPVGKVPCRDAEKKRNSQKDLPATLRAALPTMLREVFRVAMQAGAKAQRKKGVEICEMVRPIMPLPKFWVAS